MRKRLYYLPFLVMAFASLIFLCKPVFAVPLLQLDISDGVYDQGTQTIVATGTIFTLYALINPLSGQFEFEQEDPYMSGMADGGWDFYISVALVPMTGPGSATPGSFEFDGHIVDVTDDMIYGAPGCLSQPHGIFDTYYWENSFNFISTNTAVLYNSQDNPGGFNAAPGGTLYYADFLVDTTNLAPEYAIHFDLYDCAVPGHFAPFSHDAQSRVPEPSTMLLLGSGLIGLGVLGRKKLFKRG